MSQVKIDNTGIFVKEEGANEYETVLKGSIHDLHLTVDDMYVGLIVLGADGRFFFNGLAFTHQLDGTILHLHVKRRGTI